MANRWGNSGNSETLFSWATKILWTVTETMKVKETLAPWKKSYHQLRQHIKKQRHCFADKGPYSRSYGFSRSHGWMWELDHKEGWAAKNWCFQTVLLEKTLESPLNCKEIKSVNPKENQLWIFTGRTGAKAEVPILWPPDVKSWLIGKDPDAQEDWRHEEKGDRGWDCWMTSWLNGYEFQRAPGHSKGQGSLAWYSPWGHESDMT